MREIKFRAWDKDDNRMIIHEQDFIPLKICSLGVLRLCPEYRVPLYIIAPIERFELMQYTGLKDSKGVEIFEGDLIDSYQNDYAPTEVYWDNDCSQWSTQNYHSTLNLSGSMDLDTKIVGNIHENPELL